MTTKESAMTTVNKVSIGIAFIALSFSVYASLVTQAVVDYDIAKSCAKNKAFQIKGVHYYCVEIQERKK